jgi:hypothetical protein
MALKDLSVVLSGSSSLGAHASEAFAIGLGGSSSLSAHAKAKYAGRASLGGSSSFSAHARVKYAVRVLFDGSSGLVADPTVSLGVQSPIRYQPPSRTVNVSKLVLDQVDLFRTDGKTRSQGVGVGDLNLKLFFNNSQVDWPLVNGSSTQDIQVTAGQVYWTEFLSGFYTIRFFPNVVGSWRVLLTYPAYDQAVSLSYEVALPTFIPVSSGIRASFIKR